MDASNGKTARGLQIVGIVLLLMAAGLAVWHAYNNARLTDTYVEKKRGLREAGPRANGLE